MAKTAKKAAKKESGDSSAYDKNLKVLEGLKEKAQKARSAFQSFVKSNNLSLKLAPTDKKLKAEWTKLNDTYSAARKERDEAELKVKESKPRKERALKYDYPPDCVDKVARKNYRTAMRKKAEGSSKPKKAAKAEKTGKPSKGKAAKVETKKAKGKKAKKSSSED